MLSAREKAGREREKVREKEGCETETSIGPQPETEPAN